MPMMRMRWVPPIEAVTSTVSPSTTWVTVHVVGAGAHWLGAHCPSRSAGRPRASRRGERRVIMSEGVSSVGGPPTALVAPVAIGENATIGAGSIITRDAPAGKLTVARAKQHTLDGWQRPVQKPKQAKPL